MLKKFSLIIGIVALLFISIPFVRYAKMKEIEAIQSEKEQIQYKIPDIELNKISNKQMLVRNFIVNYSNVSDEILKRYAYQIENCPQYLLETVDEILIIPHSELTKFNPNCTDTTIASHVHRESFSTIYLTDYETEDQTVFEHEAIHAYDAEYGITKQAAFINIYQLEGLDYDERADDIKEYFAYSYVDFLEDKLDKDQYPETYTFYTNLN